MRISKAILKEIVEKHSEMESIRFYGEYAHITMGLDYFSRLKIVEYLIWNQIDHKTELDGMDFRVKFNFHQVRGYSFVAWLLNKTDPKELEKIKDTPLAWVVAQVKQFK